MSCPLLLDARARGRRLALLVTPVAALAWLPACGGLGGYDRRVEDRINRRIDALTLDQSMLLGTDAAPAERRYRTEGVSKLDRDLQLDKSPPTNNPDAEQLRYVQAEAARLEAASVEGRLQQFFGEALGIDTGLVGYGYDEGVEGEERPDLDIPSDVMRLDLPTALRQAQITGRDFLFAQEDYLLAAIALLSERHLWSPRFFNDTMATFSGGADDGQLDGVIDLMNELRVTQLLPNGGDIAASWIVSATEQLRNEVSGQYVQSSELVLDANIPLFRGAGSVAREDLIQAERDLVYAARDFERFRREFLVTVASTYFSLLQDASAIRNLSEQLRNLRRTLERQQARQEAGEIALFELNITRSSVLAANNSLQGTLESFILSLDSFKILLGLDPRTPVVLAPLELELNDPVATPTEAAAAALLYRLDLQTERDEVLDARRAVYNARNEVLPDFDFFGQASLPTDPDVREGGLAFDPDDFGYSAGFRFSLPLDRRIERLAVRSSQIALEREIRDFEEFRDSIVVASRSALRSIEVARFQLILAERQVEINELRFEEQLIKEDEVTPQELVDTQAELLDARNARTAAEADLRNAILAYLLTTGQLRVGRDGNLLPLPGMDLTPPQGVAP
ncbi:MAG: TolC family protein [Planctomycetota bacterium]